MNECHNLERLFFTSFQTPKLIQFNRNLEGALSILWWVVHFYLFQGIVVGITLDLGPKPLYGGLKGETETQGLDNLDERCIKYKVYVINTHIKCLN